MISYANPKAQYLQYKEEIDAAIFNVLNRGNYILGEEVVSFENEFSKYQGAKFAIGCASGTDALVLALRAIDIGQNDEVIVPSHTATPTVAAVSMVGASPVYVDVESDYYTIDPSKLSAACTSKTKAIIAVHIYGQSAAMDEVMDISRQYNLRVIEDCAQAAGASYRGNKLGTIGDFGCFSFFPTKNLSAIGDGGAVICSDKKFANKLLRLRQYGWDENRVSQEPGINSRLDELQAAVLRVKLRYLDADNAKRQSQADVYNKELMGLPIKLPARRIEASHVHHLYVVQTEKREALIKYLYDYGITPGIHYKIPVHKMQAFKSNISLSVTEMLSSTVLSLPIYPGLDSDIQKRVTDVLGKYFD